MKSRRGGGGDKVDREEGRKRRRRRCGSPGWERLEDFSVVARGGKDEGVAGSRRRRKRRSY